MKSILLHVQDDVSLNVRIETALSLARASSGHLSALHVTPIEAYMAVDSFGGVFVMNDVLEALLQHEADLRQRVEDHLRKEDVSWDYQQVTGSVLNAIVSHAALADVVVTGRESHKITQAAPALSFIGDLLHRSRTPLVIPPSNGAMGDPTGPVLIAWDGSYEAANAVRSSLSLLRLASKVAVFQVEDEAENLFPATRLLKYLSRHEIHAELRLQNIDKHRVPDALADCAQEIGATYLVMGGYGRSRVGEYFFGGVTRTFLQDSPITLLIAH